MANSAKEQSGAPPTGRQVAELLAQRNVCVRAGAGTGKTRLLVELYLEMLKARRASVSDLAALTFTEKAAGEMKERIRAACLHQEQRAVDQQDRHYWRSQRYQLESAYIGTIHGFCSRLLKEFPIQAAVDPQFEVLDELSADALARDCMGDTLTALLEAESPDLLELLEHLGRRELERALFHLLSVRERLQPWAAFEGDSLEGRNKLFALVDARLAAFLSSPDWQAIALILGQSQSLHSGDLLEEKRLQVLERIEKLAASENPEARIEQARQLQELLKNAARAGRKDNWEGDSLKQARGALMRLKRLLSELAPFSGLLVKRETDAKILQLTKSLRSVHQSLSRAYQVRKAEAGLLDYSDLLIDAYRLLRTNPEVRRNLQRRLKHVLVDEFQDNSHLDQQIIYLLAAKEPLAPSAGAERLVPGKLFVVGDDKQSIFRFRGAELEVFNQLAETFGREGKVLDLNRNYRSLPATIAFTNDLFSRVMGCEKKPEAFQNQYFKLAAHRKEKPEHEAVELLLASAPAGTRLGAPEAHVLQAELVAHRIELMIQNQEPVVQDGGGSFRPPCFADIAILLRATTHISAYKRALWQRGIPYSVIADRGFYQVQEIMDCVNFLKFLDSEADEIALAGMLRSPFFAISDNALLHLSFAPSFREGMENCEQYVPASEDREKLRRAREVVNQLRHLKARRSLPQLMDAIIELTGYDAVLLSQFMGRQKWANVQKLRDQAATRAPGGGWSLRQFVQYVDPLMKAAARGGEAPSEEQESNVVKLITIHKAKGLEFPVVFLPGLSDQMRGRRGSTLLIDRNLGIGMRLEDEEGQTQASCVYSFIRWLERRKAEAESKRLFYVACTRARDLLVLTGTWERRPASGSWMSWLRDTFEMSPRAEGEDSFFTFGKEDASFRARVRTKLPQPARPEKPASGPQPGETRSELSPGEVQEMLRRVAPIPVNLSGKRHFTASALAEYDFCPRSYQLKRVLAIPEPHISVSEPTFEKGENGEELGAGRAETARLRGIITHNILGRLDWSAMPDEPGNRMVAQAVQEALGAQPLLASEVRKRLADELSALLRNFVSTPIASTIAAAEVRYPEFPFSLSLDGAIIEGRIDLLFRGEDEGWRILDYKSDAIGRQEVASRAELYWPQLRIYALACERLGKMPGELLLCFLGPARVSRQAFDQGKLEEARSKILGTIASIRQSKFPHNPERCAFCPYRGLCERIAS